MTDEQIKHAAMHFEAVKVSMSQDKNGIILRLNVHPNDCPKELHTDWVGTRYVVAMVRLQDDDTIDDRGFVATQRMIASAGMLCRSMEFHSFLVKEGLASPCPSSDPAKVEEASVAALHEICGIKSRSELSTNESARQNFEALRRSFRLWKEGKSP